MYGDRPRRTPQLLIVIALAALAVFAQTARAGAAASGTVNGGEPAATASPVRWGWPLPADAAVLLGFGSAYGSGSQTRTHTGCDLAGQAGESVRAPSAATVTFVGEVPSGSDRRLLTVTLEAPDGAKLTLMPLKNASVSTGDRVSAGECIGMLAGDGDASSDPTHLHVGLRHGSLYVDPLSMLTPPSADVAQPSATARPETKPAIASRPVAVQPAATPIVHPAAAGAPAPTLAQAPTPRAAEPRVSTRTSSTRSEARTPQGARAAGTVVAGSSAAATTRSGVGAVARAARSVAAANGPSLVTSLPTLMRAFRTRDRLVATIVSYLLATIAATGSVAAVVKRARVPIGDAPAMVSAAADTD